MSTTSITKSLSNIVKPKAKKTKTVSTADTKSSSYTIKIPRITRIKDLPTNFYLVLTIIIFAFFLGMLTNKVFDLESQMHTTSNGSAAAAPTDTAALPSSQPSPAGPVNVSVGKYPIRGNDNAKVTVIEFADFRCPFCEQWFKTVEPNLIKDYVNTGKIKFAFRNYAFLGPASTLAANAGECANEQNQFWAFHDYMYQNQPDETDTSMFTVDNLSQIAGNLGMDQSQFQSCLTNNKYDSDVQKDMKDGQAAGVSGTPTTFVNGVAIVGAVPYSQLKAAIDHALK